MDLTIFKRQIEKLGASYIDLYLSCGNYGRMEVTEDMLDSEESLVEAIDNFLEHYWNADTWKYETLDDNRVLIEMRNRGVIRYE